MRLIRGLGVTTCLTFFLAPAALDSVSRPASETPVLSSVFLVTIDTLRADHVGCYGDRNIRTPALDGLAADGIRFANAFTASPITNASHASILTGMLPLHHGVRNFGMALDPGVATLAEALKERGYSTAAFIGAVILDSHGFVPGLDRGFDYYDHFPEHVSPTASRYVRLERRGMEVERRAEGWMAKSGATTPKFVWIHLYDPHDPYDPPEPFHSEYAGRLYDGEIAYADSALGRLVVFLKARELYDSSMIIVVGDHGEGLGDHGEQTHGIFLYDSTLHVPLIIKLPRESSQHPSDAGTRGGITIGAQVRTIDIAPTILDLEGLPEPKPVDGISLRTLWLQAAEDTEDTNASAGTGSERVAFGETDYPLAFGWAPLRSVRAEGRKYIEAPRPELYDLGTDPGETRNLYEPWNTEVQKLRAMETDLRGKVLPAGSQSRSVGSATIEELRALGYLGTDAGSTTAPEPSLLPDPKDKIQVHNLIHSAMLAEEDNHVEEARRGLEAALRLDSKSVAVLAQLGGVELRARQYRRAADLLGQALAIQPGNGGAAYDQARALEAAGDLRGAQARLLSSESLLADNYDALCLAGRVNERLEDWEKAEDSLQAAIILNSRRPEAYIELARVDLAEKKPGEALHELDLADQLAPGSKQVLDLREQARHIQSASGRPAVAKH